MRSLLKATDGTPKYPLKRAAEKLIDVATRIEGDEIKRRVATGASIKKHMKTVIASETTKADTMRRAYVSKQLLAGPQQPSVETLKSTIKGLLAAEFGKKGPVDNAHNILDTFARRALVAGYPMGNREVQTAFMYFLMAYVTEGFEGKDTTGTQMGNFQGHWRGGGF